MNKIVEILMERDGMSQDEAQSLVDETRDVIWNLGSFDVDDIVADMLGLEPDYILDLLD